MIRSNSLPFNLTLFDLEHFSDNLGKFAEPNSTIRRRRWRNGWDCFAISMILLHLSQNFWVLVRHVAHLALYKIESILIDFFFDCRQSVWCFGSAWSIASRESSSAAKNSAFSTAWEFCQSWWFFRTNEITDRSIHWEIPRSTLGIFNSTCFNSWW